MATSRDAESPAPGGTATRWLVVVMGGLRGGEQTRQSLVRHVLEPLGAHLAVLVSPGEPVQKRRPWEQAAQHVWRVDEYNDWGQFIDRLVGHGWRRNVSLAQNLWGGVWTDRWLGTSTGPDGKLSWEEVRVAPAQRLSGSGAILLALRMVVLSHLRALPTGAYDQVILTRSDLYHDCTHARIVAQPDELWAPSGEWSGGVTDRHHVFAFASAGRVLSLLPWLTDGTHREPSSLQTRPGRRDLNLEQALKLHADAIGLRIRAFPRSMFVAGDKRAGDRSSWGFYGFPAMLEGNTTLWCKYPREMLEATRTCRGRRHGIGCARPTADFWLQRDAARKDGWLLKRGIGDAFQDVIGAARGNISTARRARYAALVAHGDLFDAPDALAHARDVRQLMRTGRCGSGGGDTDGHLCRKRYWSYRMLVRAHPERALDMRGEDTVSGTKPSAAQRGGGRAGGS